MLLFVGILVQLGWALFSCRRNASIRANAALMQFSSAPAFTIFLALGEVDCASVRKKVCIGLCLCRLGSSILMLILEENS